MSNARWRHLDSSWEWAVDPAKPPAPGAPTLTEQDARPVAGRILGPKGDVISVVRHGTEPPPFGFQGGPA